MTEAPAGRSPGTRESDDGSDRPFRGLRNWLRQLRGERAGEQDLRTSL